LRWILQFFRNFWADDQSEANERGLCERQMLWVHRQ
jgi:hypothetical protein